MKKKRRVFLCLLLALVVVLCSVFGVLLYQENQSRNWFPEWKEAPEYKSAPGVQLLFTGINFEIKREVYDTSSHPGEVLYENVLDQILIRVSSSDPVKYSEGYYLEYNHEGKWYRVFSVPPMPGLEHPQYLGAGETKELSFLVLSGLLSRKGTFRLYIADLGYCDMDIM